METTNLAHIAHLAEICSQRGIRNVVLSPGSRNAPLIIAFDEHPEIKTWLIHDERCAAFFAIGLSEALNQPVAITCTSGSAPLNYSPGLAEAYYRHIPILVLTADRPAEWIDQGDGQTIRQENVFRNFIKAQFTLPEFRSANDLLPSDKIVNDALTQLMTIPKGPVHINIPFNEPLYGIATLQTMPGVEYPKAVEMPLSAEEKSLIEKEWKTAGKKLVLVGQLDPDRRMPGCLQGVINDPSVAILVENTSNLSHFQKIVHCIDRTLAVIDEDQLENFAPDLLVTIGGAIISKKIKAFLRTRKPKVNWRVGQFLFEEDTYKSLTHSFKCSPYHFFECVDAVQYLPESTYGDKWKQKDFVAKERHLQFLAQTGFCDFKAFEHVIETLPMNANLHMGNSSVVRYCQLFDPDPSLSYYSNRGVSGIDGSTSTAAGFSVAQPSKMNVLISGDVSFFYDSNGLWNNYLGSNFRVIVINNGGGGIFQILEGSNSVKQASIFFSPHQASVKLMSEAFGCTYLSAESEAELEKVLPDFYNATNPVKPVILEVKTFSYSNAKVLKDYFAYLGRHK